MPEARIPEPRAASARPTGGALRPYLARLRTSLHEGGGGAALRQIAASLRWRIDPRCRALDALNRENEAYDARYGTDTRAEVPLEALGLGAEQAQHGNGLYRAVSRTRFRAALDRLDLPFGNYTFVDYGAGKGKALLLACEYPFRRIVGVEYAEPLCEIARANLLRHPLAASRGERIEALCADARDYAPPVEPLVCFFFNPFDQSVWRSVLHRLERHHAAYRMPIHLVYLNFRDVGEIGDVFHEFPVFVPLVRERELMILSTNPARARH